MIGYYEHLKGYAEDYRQDNDCYVWSSVHGDLRTIKVIPKLLIRTGCV